MRNDLDLSPVEQREAILNKVASIKTAGEAEAYMAGVARQMQRRELRRRGPARAFR